MYLDRHCVPPSLLRYMYTDCPHPSTHPPAAQPSAHLTYHFRRPRPFPPPPTDTTIDALHTYEEPHTSPLSAPGFAWTLARPPNLRTCRTLQAQRASPSRPERRMVPRYMQQSHSSVISETHRTRIVCRFAVSGTKIPEKYSGPRESRRDLHAKPCWPAKTAVTRQS